MSDGKQRERVLPSDGRFSRCRNNGNGNISSLLEAPLSMDVTYILIDISSSLQILWLHLGVNKDLLKYESSWRKSYKYSVVVSLDQGTKYLNNINNNNINKNDDSTVRHIQDKQLSAHNLPKSRLMQLKSLVLKVKIPTMMMHSDLWISLIVKIKVNIILLKIIWRWHFEFPSSQHKWISVVEGW